MAVVLLFVGRTAYTQETTLALQHKNSRLLVSAYLEKAPLEDVTISLDDGLEAEIYFQLRLYEKSQGLFAFLLCAEKPF